MRQGRASETASQAAVMRAMSLVVDDPAIFRDELAGPLCGLPDAAAVMDAVDSFKEKLAQVGPPQGVAAFIRAARISAVIRSRWAEERLQQAVARGEITQYVIVGAGMDSFAYRRPDWAGALRVFEVDHPATQQRKRERLSELGIGLPPHLTFVPLDFEGQSIMDGLQSSGYRRDEPGFFSLLGVLIYLTSEAIDRTLGQIATAAPGSEVILHYMPPPHLLGEDDRQVQRMVESLVVKSEEPSRSYFEPAQLEARVRGLGFADVLHLGPEEATRRYLADRADGLRVPALVNLLAARV